VCSCPNPQIVLTDDEAVNASFLATTLRKNGFSAEFFGSAQEALAAA
jgi:CheY-like chemotaxis protein